ncbi:MAG: NifB/NifX family molybdenum-iron cluster-binding protein [Bacteroidetes bacterium]|nr:NifB/NifX family molybdenum-iron cluster-binding protein [Bacteroidota bacterium]
MTIAISSTGNGWDSPIDERFGRAHGFFLVDEESGQTRYLDNATNLDAGHGAGPATVQLLVGAGVQVIITGRVGPKAEGALQAARITVINPEHARTVKDAWDHYSLNQQKHS